MVDKTILDKPLPDMSDARKLKLEKGYADVEVDPRHPLHEDPIVKLEDFGVRGISYYANNSWLERSGGHEAAMKNLYVRRDIAERLRSINDFLSSKDANFIHEALGGAVDVFVTDGLRPVTLIKQLYEDIIPSGIRADNPGMSEEEVMKWRDHRMAKPDSNAPHSTGGAIDLVLSFKERNQKVPNGVLRDIPETLHPEYYEILSSERELSQEEKLARTSRRVLHWLMEAAVSDRGGAGFVNNALEPWHFGTGDKLSGLLASRHAYYEQITDLPE